MKHCKGKSLRSVYRKLGFSTSAYHIRSHRNAIIFQGLINSENQIVSLIRKQVKIHIEGGQPFARSNINFKICSIWGFEDSAVK